MHVVYNNYKDICAYIIFTEQYRRRRRMMLTIYRFFVCASVVSGMQRELVMMHATFDKKRCVFFSVIIFRYANVRDKDNKRYFSSCIIFCVVDDREVVPDETFVR